MVTTPPTEHSASANNTPGRRIKAPNGISFVLSQDELPDPNVPPREDGHTTPGPSLRRTGLHALPAYGGLTQREPDRMPLEAVRYAGSGVWPCRPASSGWHFPDLRRSRPTNTH